jgi:hypothetical protein
MKYDNAFKQFRAVYDSIEKLESLIAENGEGNTEPFTAVIRIVKTTVDMLAMAEVILADYLSEEASR